MEDCKYSDEIVYSIIIPHKNSSDLLQRCLNSIPRRNDVQIIVVDDNSDSDQVDFSCFPGIGESNVEVYFTKKGRGAGYARNVGLKHAKGKWLLFIDADDFLAPDFFQKVDSYANNNNDIVYFRLADESYIPFISPHLRNIIDVRRGGDYNMLLKKDEEYIKLIHNIPVGKLIRTSCVQENEILFDEIPCANDIMFFTKLAFCITKVAVSLEYLYCVSKPTGKNLTSRKDYNSGKVRLLVLLERNDLLMCRGYKELRTPPMLILWQFRTVGLRGLFSYCRIIIDSSTPLCLNVSKFIRSPFTYLK